MPIFAMVALIHQPAPKNMVAEPFVIETMEPSDDQIMRAVGDMGSDQFMLILSRIDAVDVLTDSDALIVEFAERCGFMLYQQSNGHEFNSTPWRSKSAMNILTPSTIRPDEVPEIIAAFGSGLSFDAFASKFPTI